MNRRLGLLLLPMLSSCDDWNSSAVEQVRTSTSPCGGWSMTFNLPAHQRPYTVRADGVTVATWQMADDGEREAHGVGIPGETIAIQVLRDENVLRSTSMQAGAGGARLALSAPRRWTPQDPGEVIAQVVASCEDVEREVRFHWNNNDSVVVPVVNGAARWVPHAPYPGDRVLWASLYEGGSVVFQSSRVLDVVTTCEDIDNDGVTSCGGDCDDVNPLKSPKLTEIIGNGIDDDCDGINGQDVDRDGFEAAAAGGTDCRDDDPDAHPGRPDARDRDGDGFRAADGLDDNCDGIADEDLTGVTDCDDLDPGVWPGAAERVDNERDDNCDGRVDEGGPKYDDDGDGVTERDGDCDDANPDVHPGADEIVDCIDADCDGSWTDGAPGPELHDPAEDSGGGDVSLGLAPRGTHTHRVRAVLGGKLDVDRWTFELGDHNGDNINVIVTPVKWSGPQPLEVNVWEPKEGWADWQSLSRGPIERSLWFGLAAKTVQVEVRQMSLPHACPVELDIQTQWGNAE